MNLGPGAGILEPVREGPESGRGGLDFPIVPEMPEVQALAERLEERYAGAKLVAAEPIAFAALKTVTPSPSDLVGAGLESVGRRGKFLILSLSPPSLRMLIHLSQGGRVVLEKPGGARH